MKMIMVSEDRELLLDHPQISSREAMMAARERPRTYMAGKLISSHPTYCCARDVWLVIVVVLVLVLVMRCDGFRWTNWKYIAVGFLDGL
jgi:hypothetical protein